MKESSAKDHKLMKTYGREWLVCKCVLGEEDVLQDRGQERPFIPLGRDTTTVNILLFTFTYIFYSVASKSSSKMQIMKNLQYFSYLHQNNFSSTLLFTFLKYPCISYKKFLYQNGIVLCILFCNTLIVSLEIVAKSCFLVSLLSILPQPL